MPHGTRTLGDTRLYLQHMLVQVSTLQRLLNSSEDTVLQWKSLTRRFPKIDDIIARINELECLTSLEMRTSLIRLYQTYASEWNIVKRQISDDFLDQVLEQVTEQQVSQDLQMVIQ